jgi:uncharacterized GH25 family protein
MSVLNRTTRRPSRPHLYLSCGLLWLSFTSQAHVPYLAPESFEPIRDWVSLEAAFADKFFLPEAKFDQSEFQVFAPSGQREVPSEQAMVRSRTVLEHQLKAEGTYRFSTGQRFGAVFKSWQQDGKTVNSRDPKQQPPAGVKLSGHFQSVTLAETYVSKGKPDQAVLKPHGQGLEIAFISHPNDLYINQPIKTRLLFNGKPLVNAQLKLHQSGHSDEQQSQQLESDANGDVQFSVPEPATYLLLVRHRAPAPANAKAPEYSYSYSAVVEITD